MSPPLQEPEGEESSGAQPSSTRRFPELRVRLPDWVASMLPAPEHRFETLEERMRLVIELSRLNVEHGTGGPFGAAIFNMETHTLLAPGVNLVVSTKWSGGHGEMVAYAMAQQLVQSHDLGGAGMPRFELVSSTEPCAMCLGATPWAGIRRLVCGAREEDARAIGFDEGPKVTDWVHALETRGIQVVRDVLRDEASAILRAYVEEGGFIYNGRMGE